MKKKYQKCTFYPKKTWYENSPRTKKKRLHASYILNNRSKEHFLHIWKNKPCISFVHGIKYVCCIFICLDLHISLIGRNKSCMNYTNEMMHVQNGQGEVVWFFFYMNVMVWLCVTITETSWHIKHTERTSCKPNLNRHDFM